MKPHIGMMKGHAMKGGAMKGQMEEIAEFLGDDPAARLIFQGMAALCRRLAADQAGEQAEIGSLDEFIARLTKPA